MMEAKKFPLTGCGGCGYIWDPERSEKELPLWREMRTETGKKRYGIALEAGTHTFYWKIPEFYDMIEHTFDMAEQWAFSDEAGG